MFILKRWFGWIPWKAWIVLVLATLLGVGLAIGVFYAIRVNEQQMNKMMFYNAADNAGLYISSQMAQLSAMLQDIANFVSYDSRLPTYDEFNAFVQPTFQASPAVVAIEYVPFFTDAARAQWVAANTMVSNYTLMAFSLASGALVPEATHSTYFPVYYVVPFEAHKVNQIMVGIDLATLPQRSELLEAVQNNKIIAFPTPYFEQGMLSGYGIALGIPVMNGTAGGSPVGAVVGLLSLDFIAMSAYMEQMMIMAETGSMSTGSFEYAIWQDNGMGPGGEEQYAFLFYADGNMNDMTQMMMGMNTTGMMSGMTMTMASTSTGATTGSGTTGGTTGSMMMHMTNMVSSGASANGWTYNIGNPGPYTDPSKLRGPLVRVEMIDFESIKWVMVCVNNDSWGTWVPWTMMGIVLALTVLLDGYLVFSIWGYKKAFDAANESSTNGDSSGMFHNKAVSNGHTNGDATKDDNID